ncbi:DUF421 domain-containing protein [Jeotgalibacillus campisalis]|uniref:YetF C-terminal domain-containing protein n=1 Tax=Jeotgalibacillus campisalis TaxID=220754 RepID=A0A0C2W4F3_9BACL|nr:DUF421 domain-containing protein [Jeotgalibacillus campisalis]KIL50933.1 hypothetical protein KR50_08140 [Jeotgalibacillus campisalis]
MEWDLLWKAVIIVLGGTFLLRFAGRKSISQMTLTQTVIMIGIGSLLIQPLAGENIWTTLLVGAVLVVTLVGMEFFQIQSDGVEKVITGKSKIVLENGHLHEKNLRKLRLTVDQLEMKLRQQNVSKITDIKWATLEPNGQVGFELKKDAKPITFAEFQQLQQSLDQIMQHLGIVSHAKEQNTEEAAQDLFTEVHQHEHSVRPPKHLQ